MKTFIVGRSQDSDIVINDQYVSRRHFQLTIYDNGKVSIKDLGSKTGTFVNGKKIFGEYFLTGNDKVKIGTTIFPWQKYIYADKGKPVQKSEDQLLATKYVPNRNTSYGNNFLEFLNKYKAVFIGFFAVFILGLAAYFILFFHPTRTFEKIYTFDQVKKLEVFDISQINNDDYVLCGYVEEDDGEVKGVIIRLDKEGKRTGDIKKYFQDNGLLLTRIIETDGDYITCGYSLKEDDDGNEFFRTVVLKTDKEGRKIWGKTYGNMELKRIIPGNLCKIIETNDGGYLIGGVQQKEDRYDYDLIIIKIDENGSIEWKKRLGGKDDEYFGDLIETDEGYAILGSTRSKGKGIQDFYFVILDKETGDKNFSKTYGSKGYEIGISIVQSDDGGFLLLGNTSKKDDILLIKIDSEGEKIWQKRYGGKEHEKAAGIIKTGGEYWIGGSTESQGEGGYDVWVIKINADDDAEGEIIWEKTYGEEKNEEAIKIKKTSDGGFVLLCKNETKIDDDDDESGFWVIKLNKEGKLEK